MKINQQDLQTSDYDTLFTRDPGKFIEAIIINLMWSKGEENEAATIAGQRHIFEKWLTFYTESITTGYTSNVQAAEERGKRSGAIYALSNLPMKKSILSQYVDLIKVAEILRDLKAKEVNETNAN